MKFSSIIPFLTFREVNFLTNLIYKINICRTTKPSKDIEKTKVNPAQLSYSSFLIQYNPIPLK